MPVTPDTWFPYTQYLLVLLLGSLFIVFVCVMISDRTKNVIGWLLGLEEPPGADGADLYCQE